MSNSINQLERHLSAIQALMSNISMEAERKTFELTDEREWANEVFSDLLVTLEEDLSRSKATSTSRNRHLTVFERQVIESAPHSIRDYWLSEMEDNLRTHILSQTKLIGAYPYDDEVANAELESAVTRTY